MSTDKDSMILGLRLAIAFHEAYERLAPSFGYETRKDTRAFDPESANGKLMMAVCGEVRDAEIERLRAALDEAIEFIAQDWPGLAENMRRKHLPADQFRDVWQAVDAGEWVHGDDARNAMLWKIRKLRSSVTSLNRARETERQMLRAFTDDFETAGGMCICCGGYGEHNEVCRIGKVIAYFENETTLNDAPMDGTPTIAKVALGTPIANEGAIPSGAAKLVAKLNNVAVWLKGGCDPQHAVTELGLICDWIQGAEPAGYSLNQREQQ